MSGLGKTADLLVGRLKELDLKRPARNRDRVEAALRELYRFMNHAFPGLTWIPDLGKAAQPLMQSGVDRFRATGALRNPQWLFQSLSHAMFEAAGTGPTKGAWFTTVHPIRQRCGNEPRDFIQRIGRLRVEARKAARKAMKADVFDRRLDAGFSSAADRVVDAAGTLFLPEEKEAAKKELASSARSNALVFTDEIAGGIDSLAEWEFRGVAVERQEKVLLQLVDAVDAGLWCFWPGSGGVIAVPRPKLR